MAAWNSPSGTAAGSSNSRISSVEDYADPIDHFADVGLSPSLDLGRFRAVPVSRTFGTHVGREGVQTQRLQPEHEGIERGLVRVVVAVELAGRSQDGEKILDRYQVAHLLFGDAEDGLLPSADVVLLVTRHIGAPQCVCSEQVLDHQRMLNLGGNPQ